MSRISLAELQGMSREELFTHWMNAKWPFDKARKCGMCLTQHAAQGACNRADHQILRDSLPPRHGENLEIVDVEDYIKANFPALYAARIFFDPFYAPMVEQEERGRGGA